MCGDEHFCSHFYHQWVSQRLRWYWIDNHGKVKDRLIIEWRAEPALDVMEAGHENSEFDLQDVFNVWESQRLSHLPGTVASFGMG
jgi:hypothetical protein